VSKTRYGCSFRRVQYTFHNATAITPAATATEKPPKNDPISNFLPALDFAVVAVVIKDDAAVVMFMSVGRPHTTDKLKRQLMMLIHH